MSIPAAAVTSGGRLMVNAGSITAIVGRSRQWLIPVFTRIDKMSMMQTLVLSAPVPAVVGTANSGFSSPGGIRARPTGALR